jgi:type I restriction enzyme S subunit
MGRYQGYKKYKESGVEWLGEIPDHWEVGRFSHFIDFQEGPGIMAVDFLDYGVPLLRIHNLKSGFVDLEGCNYLDPQKVKKVWNHFKLKKNDLLISCSASTGLVSVVDDNSENSIAYTGIIRLNPANQRICREFIKVLVNSELFSNQIDLLKTGTTIQHYGPVHLRQIKITLPPLDEQESIAHFLDRKTSQIDALIAKKTALLEKLDEKRTALISHAVTKGLDSSVPMKDSGVEWLGDIPEHWTVSKARFASSIFVPQRNKPELNSDEGLSWVTMDDMSNERIKETLFKVSDIAFKIAGSKMLKKNSVIASCIGNFGICAINDMDVIINQQLQAFIPFNALIPEYLCEIVRISNDYFKMIATAATVVYLNQTGFANMPILLPPRKEQEEIISFIVLRKASIDRQKAKVKEAIELLKEYRTALITNAVTGKIDVRQVGRV